MDLYLSNIMWKKLEDGSFRIKLIDFDAAQAMDEMMSPKVLQRLAEKEADLLQLYGVKPTKEFDELYLEIFEENVDVQELQEAQNTEERKDPGILKSRLDHWCTKKKGVC